MRRVSARGGEGSKRLLREPGSYSLKYPFFCQCTFHWPLFTGHCLEGEADAEAQTAEIAKSAFPLRRQGTEIEIDGLMGAVGVEEGKDIVAEGQLDGFDGIPPEIDLG